MAEDLGKDMRSSLEKQLSELNSRSRWYASQIWQLPLGYIAVVGLLVGRITDPIVAGLGFLAASLLGAFACEHLWRAHDGVKRAVENIQKVEERLGLEVTAQWNQQIAKPMMWIQRLATAMFLSIGVVILARY